MKAEQYILKGYYSIVKITCKACTITNAALIQPSFELILLYCAAWSFILPTTCCYIRQNYQLFHVKKKAGGIKRLLLNNSLNNYLYSKDSITSKKQGCTHFSACSLSGYWAVCWPYIQRLGYLQAITSSLVSKPPPDRQLVSHRGANP